MKRLGLGGLLGCLLVFGLLLTVESAAAKGEKVSELYRATPGAVQTASSASVDIKIHRYSTEEDGQTLAEALQANGASGLHKALKKQKKTGSVSIRGESGHPTFFTRAYEEGGKRHIVIVTDQGTVFSQAFKDEYNGKNPFTVITMMLDGEGNGEGKALMGTEIAWDDAKGMPKLAGDPVGMVQLSGIRLVRKK
jgi:hypothetical protein